MQSLRATTLPQSTTTARASCAGTPACLIAPCRPHPALPAAGGQLVKDELGISLDKADDSILGTAAKVRTRPPASLPALLACFL